MVAAGALVITEHGVRWWFVSGDIIDLPFAAVREASDGMITRWNDYSNLPNILDNAPAEWIEHIANGWK